MIFGVLHRKNLLLKIPREHVLTRLRYFAQNIGVFGYQIIHHLWIANINVGLVQNLPNSDFVVLLDIAFLAGPFLNIIKNVSQNENATKKGINKFFKDMANGRVGDKELSFDINV